MVGDALEGHPLDAIEVVEAVEQRLGKGCAQGVVGVVADHFQEPAQEKWLDRLATEPLSIVDIPGVNPAGVTAKGRGSVLRKGITYCVLERWA